MRNKRIMKTLRIVLVVAFLAAQFLSASLVYADAAPEKVTGTVRYTSGTSAYLTATYTNLSPSVNTYGISNNTGYNAWCVDKQLTITTNTNYSVILYNPADGTWLNDSSITGEPARWASIPWKKITWIINNQGSYNESVVQNAIWKLTNPSETINDSAADTLIGQLPNPLPECSSYPVQLLVNFQANNKQLLVTEYSPTKYPFLYDKNNVAATGAQDDPNDPYQQGVDVTVLNEGSMLLTNYEFVEWNTMSDGSGDEYDPADTFRMPGEQVTLYAQWRFVPNPDISLLKTADPTSGVDVGDTINYSIVATNTGNVTIYDVEITDAMLPGLTGNTALSLAPGATLTATGSYIADEDDIWAGKIENTAHVTADSTVEQSEPDLEASSKATVTTVRPNPMITLTKVPNKTSGLAEDEVVTYTFTITNTGNVTLYSVLVTDSGVDFISSSDDVGVMSPGAVETATATYTIQEADVVFGSYRNDAEVTGLTRNQQVISDKAFAVVETEKATTGLEILKEATPTSGLEVGDVVSYTLTVTNNGNTTAYDVVVTDSMLGIDTSLTPYDLDGGGTETHYGSYIVQESDLWVGQIDNTAYVTGFTVDLNGDGTPDLAHNDSVTVYTVASNPAISIVKTVVGDPNHVYSPGDTISYEMLVTNTGNVTLYYVEVTDGGLDSLSNATQEILMTGASFTATGTYEVQEGDIYAGATYDNTATVEGNYGPWAHNHEEDGTVSDEDSASAKLLSPNEAVEITKTANVSSVMVGDSIIYTVYVTNTGNVPIWGTFVDPMLGIQQYFSLDIGASTTPIVETYVTDSGDVPQVVNTASVYLNMEGTGDGELPTPDDTATVTVTVSELPPPPTPTPTPPPPVLVPNILVTITPDATLVEVGTSVNFTMVVTNTGQTVLRDVVVDNPDLGFTTTIPILYVLGSETFSAPKVLNDVGNFTPTVTATGNSTGTAVSSVSDTDVTAVEVYEIIIPPTPTPPPLDPPENPETGAVPFDAYSVTGLLAMGAGIFALVTRKKEDDEDEEN